MEEAPLHIFSASLCAAHARSPTSEPSAAACAAGTVQDLLARGASVPSVTMALLPRCAQRGGLRGVAFLIDVVGVDPNYRGRQGMTGLIMAARGGKGEIVRALLEYDALDPGIGDDAGKRALDYATANGKTEIVALLEGRS